MEYLVQMALADSARARTLEEGRALIEDYVIPTLELCRAHAAQGRILAGGPVGGSIALALVVRVASAQELDELIEGLPLWPWMTTTVTPLTTFEGRIAAVAPRLARIKSRLDASAAASAR